MVTLFSGDFEKLHTLIFNFYDFSRDGTIDKEDIRRILSYIPLKTKPKSVRLKFEKENFDDRVESQNELHQKLDKIFNNKQKISKNEFKSKNNDTVLKRRKSRDLSGGEQFKIYATLLEDEKK